MGDNIWLGDRDGVRTPMQWSPERNAGFSTADPGRLARQPVMDSVFGYHAVNVESQQLNPSSVLHWTRMMIATRKQNPALGLGAYEDIAGSNEKVFAFIRTRGNDTVLCVNNLSPYPQATELDLSRWPGVQPVELFGDTSSPRLLPNGHSSSQSPDIHSSGFASPIRSRAPVELAMPQRLYFGSVRCRAAVRT